MNLGMIIKALLLRKAVTLKADCLRASIEDYSYGAEESILIHQSYLLF